MNKGHKLLSLLLCAAVLLTLISPAALAEGETLPENEVVLSQAPAASAAQEGASGEAAEETPASQESQAAGESPETTPAESPAESPKESPAESPKESPAESPKESPAESPKESPAQTPAGEFTISYDYNGGAAGALLMLNAAQNGENAAQGGENAAPAPAAESVTGNSGQTIVLANAPVKPDRDFAGWKSTLTGKQYAAGESYEIQGDDTLVAQWNMRSVLEISVQPEEGSKLLACEKTISAISEDEQALVEQAIKNAQPTTGDALMLSAFEPEVLASDVSFIGEDGSAQQPAEGETVPMTVTVPAGAMEGEGFWMVYHLTENSEGGYIATPVQFMPADANGASVQLAADGFSIYAVAKVHDTDTEGKAAVEGSTFNMLVEHSQVFYYKDDQYSQYTYHRYTWTIEDNNDIVRGYATPMSDLTVQLNRYQYPWFSVDALREGTVTVKLNYYYYNGTDWWHPTGTPVSGSIAFTIKVTEPTGLRIVNNIVENGTLKPVYVDEKGNRTYHDNWTYTWTAKFFHTDNSGGETEITNEDSSIDPAALYKDGSLNVAIDNGGIREETVNGKEVLHVTTYTVTAKDENGNPKGEASHRVEFGGNVLNGSFEYPAIPSGTNYAFANGTHQLFWRTTAPGPNDKLSQDVELGNDSTGNPYLLNGSAAHGSQYAELNAEAVGTLYQDVLTAPGAELSWGFSHRSRKYTRDNVMFLIIASSKDGAKIHTQADINGLIEQYNRSNGDGEPVSYKGGSYTLWKMEGDANHWQNHFGSYTVPHGQYATRFFFASASGKTMGNLIDNVTFNQEQRYIIEYYLNGEKVDGLTETKTAEVNTIVSPQNLGNEALENAILTDSTINGESYGGETMTILPRPTVDTTHRDCRNVLRLYFVTGAITVRKVVTIENWDDLTDAERKELGFEHYVANFELYEGAPGGGQKVARASISIDLINQSLKTGVAQFMQLDDPTKPYTPKPKTAYWVKEVKELDGSTQTPLYAYGLTTTYESKNGSSDGSFTTDEQANGSVTVTNAYALHLFDLTIKTSGVEAIDENQTYIYRVRGNDAHTKVIDLTVAIHGDGQATVKNLPSGEYKVTQVNAWSWRYTPNQTEQSVTLDANGNGTVEYTQKRAQEGDKDNNKWKWLNGQHWIDNRWQGVSSSGGVPGDEGGDENSIKDGKGR